MASDSLNLRASIFELTSRWKCTSPTMIMLLWSIDRSSMEDVHSSKNVLVLSPLRADDGGR